MTSGTPRVRLAPLGAWLVAVWALGVCTAAAEPPAADLAKARAFIEKQLTGEQRTALENLAKVEGQEPARVLIELFGSRVLGERTPWPSEPSAADVAAAKSEIAAMTAAERARAEADARAAGKTLEALIAEQLSRGTRGQKSTSSSEPTEARAAAPTVVAPAKAEGAPILEIDTGGHTDRVTGLAFTADGEHLYSAGYDKVVRIWSVFSGRTIETRRGQISSRKEGEIYALALSPDGRTLAVGGLLEDTNDNGGCRTVRCGDVRIFDARLASEREGRGVETPTAVRTRPGHASSVLSLAYSPDGSLLASAGADRELAIWGGADHTGLGRYVTWPVRTEASGERLAWLPSGRSIALVNNRNAVQIVDVSATAAPRLAATLDAGERLVTVAASRDGRFIAAGSATGAIHVWRWPDGALYRTFPGDGAPVSVMSFGQGPSVARIVTGPGGASPDGRYLSRIVDAITGGDQRFEAHDNVTTAIAFAPDGETVATAGGRANDIHLWRPASPAPGQRLVGNATALYAAGFVATTRDGGSAEQARATEAAPPALYVAWGAEDPCPGKASCPETMGTLLTALEIPGKDAGELGLAARPLPLDDSSGRSSVTTIYQARLSHGPMRILRSDTPPDAPRVKDRFPVLALKRDGETREMLRRGIDKGRDHLAYSFDPSGRAIASGGRNGEIALVGVDGGAQWSARHGSGDVFAIAFDPAGRLVATGNGDGTLRLMSAATGRLVATLLPLIDGNWVIWTPQGYFAASRNSAADGFGWHVNNGRDQPASFITGRTARDLFQQPLVVESALRLADAEAAEREAIERGDIRPVSAEILKTATVPILKIVAPTTGEFATASGSRTDIAIAWPRDQKAAGQYRLHVNGRRLKDEEVVSAPWTYGELPGRKFSGLALKPGDNTIRIEAVNTSPDGSELRSEAVLTIRREGGGAETPEPGTLHIVSIGIDSYPEVTGCGRPGAPCNLEYAGRDAIAFLTEATRQLVGPGKGHGRLNARLLVNEGAATAAGVKAAPPTQQNIRSALKLLSEAGYADTAILFIAGHGVREQGYRLLPTDAVQRFDGGFDLRRLVPWSDIEDALRAAGGDRLLFLDTCRSVRGEARVHRQQSVRNDADRAIDHGIVVFASTNGEQDAYEDPTLRHGLFTHAVIEAIDGGADRNPADRQIHLREIDTFVTERVMELTRDRRTPQQPHLFIPGQSQNSVLVRLPPP